MKITNEKVYGLDESIIASGYPLSEDPNYSLKRAENLSKVVSGSGHDCFLKGIIVQFDLQADHSFWMQFQRYHFHDIISSQSKMHCLTKMNKNWHRLVVDRQKEFMDYLINFYNNPTVFPIIVDNVYILSKQELFETIIMNCPMGLELTARITSNYLQLKTIYIQRKPHKMSSWKQFCEFIEQLPLSNKLIYKERKIL